MSVQLEILANVEYLKKHQEFLIAKLKEGKEAWNNWQKEKADELINLHGVNFSINGCGIRNFEGYEFGDETNFGGATFGDGTNFVGATFGDRTMFFGATFGDNTDFTGATFGESTCFSRATFRKSASFRGARFGYATDFSKADFGDRPYFYNASFADGTYFYSATFGDQTNFFGATFGNNTAFDKATFGDNVDFTVKEKGYGFNLSGSRFKSVPKFALTSEDDKVCFVLTGASFSLSKDNLWNHTESISKLQRIKSIAEATAEVNVARDVFILQRKMERKQAWKEIVSRSFRPRMLMPAVSRSVMAFIFWALSDYGRSVVRPLLWLLGSNVVFYWVYEYLLQSHIKFSEVKTRSALFDYTLSNAVPFGKLLNPAFDRSFKTLFPDDFIIPIGVQLASIGQGVVSVVLLFLIGLGIRNYFKIG